MNLFSMTTLLAGSLLLAGCVNVQRPLTTQVVTFPEGGMVEVDGKSYGKEPAKIVLPQNEKGQLTGKAEIRVFPPNNQLHATSKVISPELTPDYTNRVPGRILLDLSAVPNSTNKVDLVEYKKKQRHAARAIKAYEPRSKPTRPVGAAAANSPKDSVSLHLD